MITNIRHICIVTKNLKKAIHFYRDFLKLKIQQQKTEEGKYIETLYGIKGLKLTYVKLSTKYEDPIPMLELYYFEDGREVNIGDFHHISFTVDNIKALKMFLAGKDIKILSEPQLDPAKKNLVMFCRDYDSNLIEFVEELKELKICQKCNIDLQPYFEKFEGDHFINFKRCPNCTEIYEEYKKC